MNYDGSIKAFSCLLNIECCVSIDKCNRFLSDHTAEKLKISKGMSMLVLMRQKEENLFDKVSAIFREKN